MFPYWILFSVFAAGALQYRPDPRRLVQGGPLLLFMALLTALMIGLRYEVGGDWINYAIILQRISSRDLWSGIFLQDPGYGLLNWLLGRAGFGISAVDLVCAALFTWGLIKFARRQPNPWLAIVVAVPYLIIVVAMGYTRQAVAIGFILAGLAEFGEKPLIRVVFYLILATAFHKTAIIIFPLVMLTTTRNRILTAGILLLSTALAYYAFVQASVDRLMVNYVEAEYNSQGAAIRVIMNLPSAAIFIFLRKRFSLKPQQESLWRNFAIASFIALVLLMTSSSSAAVDRLALYLIPVQMFVLSRLPSAFLDQGRVNGQLSLLVIIYSAAIQFVWLNYAANAGSWVPYRVGIAGPDYVYGAPE